MIQTAITKTSNSLLPYHKHILILPEAHKLINLLYSNYSERKYSLYGVCAHQGTMKFGHCISVCKPTTQGQAKEGSKGMWHLCNDEMVLSKADHSAISNEDAHILFYEAL